MAKEPDRRYAAAGALADAARAALAGTIPRHTDPAIPTKIAPTNLVRPNAHAPQYSRAYPADQQGSEAAAQQQESAASGWKPGFDAPSIVSMPGPLPSFGARAASFLIDCVIPLIITVVVQIAVLRVASIATSSNIEQTWLLSVIVTTYLGLTAFVVWNSGYRQGTTGQSIGRQVMKTKLVKIKTGRPVGFGMAVLRQICHVMDNLPCYLGYLWPLWDPKQQTFADKIVGTVVVRIDDTTKQ